MIIAKRASKCLVEARLNAGTKPAWQAHGSLGTILLYLDQVYGTTSTHPF